MVHEKKRVAISSVIAAVFITGFKLVVGIQANSLGILSEAAHSGLDLIAALMTFFAVSIADKPADKDHPYGHGKIENLSAFLETMLLVITCVWIIWEAVARLKSGVHHVEAGFWGFTVIAVAILVDISRSRALKRIAIKHNSQALEADALHFASDVWSSLVVIAGLGFVALGYPWVDSVAAISVAVLVLVVSYRLGRRTIDALMDRVPETLYEDIARSVQSVTGVEEVKGIRLRQSGARLFVDATIGISRTAPFHVAHAIMDNVEKAIHTVHKGADVIVHAEPYASKNESIADKVRMIVIEKGLQTPHNLEVYHNQGKYLIDFDIEYAGGKTFVEAHDLAATIEDEIKQTIPSVDKVTIHMEEHPPDENEIRNETDAAFDLREELRETILADARILECSDLTLLQAGDVYNLSITCLFEKTRTLDEVHRIIGEMESRLHAKFRTLRRITVHAEPGGDS